MLDSIEFDLVVAHAEAACDGLEWAKPSKPAAGWPTPVIAIVTGDEEPGRIQQMLDAGAELLLSTHLPEPILKRELYALAAQSSRRFEDRGAPPIAFPEGTCS